MYTSIDPPPHLQSVVECYWTVDSDDTTVRQEKIIPDGYPEMIFHYGDQYRINLTGSWQLQSRDLFAGQISRYFHLENTGTSGMVGVKLAPTAVRYLFGISASLLTDIVADLHTLPEVDAFSLGEGVRGLATHEERVAFLNQYFTERASAANSQSQAALEQHNLASRAVQLVLESRGMTSVAQIARTLETNDRRIERAFREYVGLSPKLYSRIIRFNAIFRLKDEGAESWSDLVYGAGYYDQSHFIRNFKEFTGEDPSSYLFDIESFANFFLKRPR